MDLVIRYLQESYLFGRFYKVQNWFTFALLALLPAIFLFIGNGAIIIAFRKWTTVIEPFHLSCTP